MGGFGSFFKGEKKKKRKSVDGSLGGFAPVFTPPEITGKTKKKER